MLRYTRWSLLILSTNIYLITFFFVDSMLIWFSHSGHVTNSKVLSSSVDLNSMQELYICFLLIYLPKYVSESPLYIYI